jgi:hypothetical protein
VRKRKMIWGREAAPREQGIHLVEDPTNLEPDALRDSVRDALSALTADELAAWRDHLLGGLMKAGMNLEACRFLIGISEDSIDNLTPSGIAHLIRYVRLNLPEAMKVVAGRLGKLLTVRNESVTKARQFRRAA